MRLLGAHAQDLVHAQESCACARILCMHKNLVHAEDLVHAHKILVHAQRCTRFLCTHKNLVHAQESCACIRYCIMRCVDNMVYYAYIISNYNIVYYACII